MKKLLFTILALPFLAACGGDDDNISGNANQNNGFAKYATRIEVPALKDGELFIAHTTTVNGKENVTYSISHDPVRKHCRWAAFTFDPSNRAINWNRNDWGRDPFQNDPELPANYVMTDHEIWNGRSGRDREFDRGHIVASYDRVYSKEANEQTFYYSNISPMYSQFNTGAWSDCEGMVQRLGRNKTFCDTLYVVKGGTIREGEYRTLEVCPTVPNHYFMALLCLKNNTYKAIGLLFKHEKGYSRTQICSIDYLESFTGIDFFCNVPDAVETEIERRYNPANWTGLKDYNDLNR